MKSAASQAMELANKLYHQEPVTEKQEKNISEDSLKVTAILWDKFTIGYQHLWSNTYGAIGEDEYHNWAKALNDVDPNKVMAGIARAIKECTDYPPNLIKFLRFCREEKAAYHQDAKFLPPPVKEDQNAIEEWKKAARELGYLPQPPKERMKS